jgi:hypothetical protein
MHNDCPGVTQLDAFEAVVADEDMPYVAMLENHAGLTDGDTFAAIGAFLYEHDKGTVVATDDCSLGANLHALAALGTNPGFIQPRLRELGLDSQAGFLGVCFIKMADSTDLCAQAASAALARRYFDSLDLHDAPAR